MVQFALGSVHPTQSAAAEQIRASVIHIGRPALPEYRLADRFLIRDTQIKKVHRGLAGTNEVAAGDPS